MPKVSIILPIYNVEKYLRQCLDSCINQTLKDIEIICVNDGSTDNCLEIINEYARKDNRIKVINQNNQGLSMARNNGVDIATGEYILFLDSDDWLELNCCKVAYNQAKENDNDFVYFNNSVYNEATGKIKKYNHIKFADKILNQKKIDIKNTKNINYIICSYIWNKLYKRSWLIENNLKFIKMQAEDTPYMVMSFLKANSISFIQQSLYIYRYRTNSLTWSIDVDGWINSRIVPIEYILSDANADNLINVYLEYVISNLIYWYYKLPLNKKDKNRFKSLIIEHFGNIKKYNWKAGASIILLKTNLMPVYRYIREILRFPNYIMKLTRRENG